MWHQPDGGSSGTARRPQWSALPCQPSRHCDSSPPPCIHLSAWKAGSAAAGACWASRRAPTPEARPPPALGGSSSSRGAPPGTAARAPAAPGIGGVGGGSDGRRGQAQGSGGSGGRPRQKGGGRQAGGASQARAGAAQGGRGGRRPRHLLVRPAAAAVLSAVDAVVGQTFPREAHWMPPPTRIFNGCCTFGCWAAGCRATSACATTGRCCTRPRRPPSAACPSLWPSTWCASFWGFFCVLRLSLRLLGTFGPMRLIQLQLNRGVIPSSPSKRCLWARCMRRGGAGRRTERAHIPVCIGFCSFG